MKENPSLRCRRLGRCKSTAAAATASSPRPAPGYVKSMCRLYSQSETRLLVDPVDQDAADTADGDDGTAAESPNFMPRHKSLSPHAAAGERMSPGTLQRLSPSGLSLKSQDSGFSDGGGCGDINPRKSSPVCEKAITEQSIDR